MSDEILERLMGVLRKAGMRLGRTRELKIPMLLARTPDNTYLSFPLVGEVHPSEQARVILAVLEATHAALCMESWTYEVNVTPAMREALDRGEPLSHAYPEYVQPKDHPDRRDMLVVLGEARGQPQVLQAWLIDTDPATGHRTFEPHGATGGQQLPARFNPLFVDEQTIRQLLYEHVELARLRDSIRSGRN